MDACIHKFAHAGLNDHSITLKDLKKEKKKRKKKGTDSHNFFFFFKYIIFINV